MRYAAIFLSVALLFGCGGQKSYEECPLYAKKWNGDKYMSGHQFPNYTFVVQVKNVSRKNVYLEGGSLTYRLAGQSGEDLVVRDSLDTTEWMTRSEIKNIHENSLTGLEVLSGKIDSLDTENGWRPNVKIVENNVRCTVTRSSWR
jgi:hypothetical protein